MSKYDWLLFFHLLAAFVMLAGALGYHVLQVALLKRDRPTQVATLFGAGKLFGPMIQAGSGAVLVFGVLLAYASDPRYTVTDEWIIAAIVLWVIANALAFVGGNIYAGGAKLAESLAASGDDKPSTELRSIIHSPRAALMTWASTLTFVAILVLMIWKPGAP